MSTDLPVTQTHTQTKLNCVPPNVVKKYTRNTLVTNALRFHSKMKQLMQMRIVL
uniref:Uncharacterized protein n=1 Tax=Anguilla anguilla TaxID=7936 RepID=A0A0E9WBL2_ANGAN